MARSVDVLVVGGGPAGLAAADALAGRGRQVALVEASARLGGMAASIEVAGLRVDLGSHRLHPVATPAAEQLITDLLGGDLQVRRRHGRIRLADRWLGFPLRGVDLLRSLPPGFAARAGVDALTGPLRRRRLGPLVPGSPADSFAAVVERGLGPTMLARFYGPYAEKLWGRPAHELAGELARRRIAAGSPRRLAAKLVRAARGGGPTFRYPRRGYGQLVEALAERAAERGAELRCGVVVSGLDGSPSGCRARLADGSEIEARRVLWTAPPGALRAALATAATTAAADGHAGPPLRHRGVVCAYVLVERPRYSEFDAHYFPGPQARAARISEPKNYRTCTADPADHTVLCAELACDVGDTTWCADRAELDAIVAHDLERAGLDQLGPGGGCVHVERLSHVYPVLEAGATLPPPDRDLPDGMAVTVLGRQGLQVADNVHHVLAMALDAVDCFGADDRWDAAAWQRAEARFARHVVED